MVRPANNAELDQSFEHSINRGPGYARNAASYIFEELIRRGMIFTIKHGLEDNSQLYRSRQMLSGQDDKGAC